MSRKQRGAPGWVLHQAWAGLEGVEGVELCPPQPQGWAELGTSDYHRAAFKASQQHFLLFWFVFFFKSFCFSFLRLKVIKK